MLEWVILLKEKGLLYVVLCLLVQLHPTLPPRESSGASYWSWGWQVVASSVFLCQLHEDPLWENTGGEQNVILARPVWFRPVPIFLSKPVTLWPSCCPQSSDTFDLFCGAWIENRSTHGLILPFSRTQFLSCVQFSPEPTARKPTFTQNSTAHFSWWLATHWTVGFP